MTPSTRRDAPRPSRAAAASHALHRRVGGCVVADRRDRRARRRPVRERRVLPHGLGSGAQPRSTEGTLAFRIAGAVVPGTSRDRDAACASRSPTARTRSPSLTVGDPPDLFKAGAPVVCEGHWAKAGRNAPFDLRSHPDPPRQRLHAAQGRHARRASRDRSAPVKAVLGFARSRSGRARACSASRVGRRAAHARTRCSCASGAGTSSSCSPPRSLAAGAMEWALLTPRLLAAVRRREQRTRPRRCCSRSPASGRRSRARSCSGCWSSAATSRSWCTGSAAAPPIRSWRGRPSSGCVVALFFFALMLGPANPFKTLGDRVPPNGRGPEPAAPEPSAHGVPPADALPRLRRLHDAVHVRDRGARSPVGSAKGGWPTPGGRRSSRGASSPSASSSARGGATRCSAGAASGRGTRSRTRRCCRGSPATAFIHSVIVQERRGMLRVWNLSLVIATFCLTILGTFLTRSGVINSVHSFTESDIGPWLLTLPRRRRASPASACIAWRGDALRAPGRIDSPISRESAFLANNLLFAGLAFVVLLGTVFPLLAEALQGSGSRSGSPYFDRMATPIGLALLFLMAVAPALPWRATSGEVRAASAARPGVDRRGHDGRRGRRSARAASPKCSSTASPRSRSPASSVSSTWECAAADARSASRGPLALGRAHALEPAPLRRARRAHRRRADRGRARGVGRVRSEREVRLRRRRVGDGVRATRSRISAAKTDALGAEDDGRRPACASSRATDDLGVYAPAVSTFPSSTDGIGTPSVRTGLLRDVYLTLVSSPNERRPGDARRAR